MQKIMSLIALAVLVAGGGWWFFASEPQPEVTLRSGADAAEDAVDHLAGVDALRSLFMRGDDLVCTFSQEADGTQNTGTAYFSDGSFRVEAITQQNGETFASTLIYNGTAVYAWTEAGDEQLAFSFTIPPEELLKEETFETETGSVSLQAEVAYSCDHWARESSFFTPPAEIEFVDMTTMLEESFGGQ